MVRAQGGVQVEGLTQWVRALEDLGLEVDDLKDAMGLIATEAAQEIQGETPVGESGRLSKNVRGNRAKSKAVVRAGSKGVPYAGVINYGWEARNIEPELFMQRGEDKYLPRAVTRLEDEINTQIKKRGLDG